MMTSEWVARCQRPVAWISLDEGDSDPTRFLTYFTAALRTIAVNLGSGVLSTLQSPQPPPIESILTPLLNEITSLPDPLVLVLDDYHLLDSKSVDEILTFLLEHQPPQMHLVIASREDPHLPLARLRARGQLTELHAADLRFTTVEATEFLNRVMGLNLSANEVSALETRTEGWISGLQLAAISLQGQHDSAGFIKSFTGSHRFVLDYLLEEVLHQQSVNIQHFLLRTSILDRLCAPLCSAVLGSPVSSGYEILEYLEHANLFIVPLDNDRCWYRYHHLFAELLRQRLQQSVSLENSETGVAEYHIRASVWFEANGLELEAFHHATAANDIERAERLLDGKGMPLHFRGMVKPVLNWLDSLPASVLDANPVLWTSYASVELVSGHKAAAEQKLQSAVAALKDPRPPAPGEAGMTSVKTRDIIGRIAAIQATLAIYEYQTETCISLSQRALENLSPDNLSFRTFTIWRLGYAYNLQGNRDAARQAYTEAVAISQATGNTITAIAATIGLGNLQESNNQLHLATQAYHRVLEMMGDQPLPLAHMAHLGLARIAYERNELEASQQYSERGAYLANQVESPDRFVNVGLIFARIRFALGDAAGAADILAQAEQSVRQHNLLRRKSEVAAAQVLVLLRQGDLGAAAQLVNMHDIPISQARIYLAQGNTPAALVLLESLYQQAEAKGWADEQLKLMVLQAVALYAYGETFKSVQLLSQALVLVEPEGFIRTFVDEGLLMARLLAETAARGIMPDYITKLMSAFEAEKQPVLAGPVVNPAQSGHKINPLPEQSLIEPLSQRELRVLQLIAQGLSNREISERLYLALSTVKGHNRIIFDKLQVESRTEAVARARELGLL
ncbi:MAG: LuxR C-terminal-related transcriptional regulator [Anaerolineae bacterium]